MNKMGRYSSYAIEVLRKEGVKAVVSRSLKKIAKESTKVADKLENEKVSKRSFFSIVDRRDVMAADIDLPMPTNAKKTKLKVINWVISPPRTGGGHMNMFRFIEHLDSIGFTNNIYLYTTHDHISPKEAADNVSAYAKLTKAHFRRYDRKTKMADADALFATGWETAYPVLNEVTSAKKFYFVQDFEPYFYPVGTEYILAESTYKFGFHGITAGRWLATKLHQEYGMICDAYDFGADSSLYMLTNKKKRKEVFFYARPVTERRAFDLGIMTLELFHAMHPDYTINLAGWDVSHCQVDFPYVNHKTLQLEELGEVYNKCAVGLVLSLTNMSLLPLELLSCGTIPVVNDADNNRLVSNNPYIAYAEPTPLELAKKMSEIVNRPKPIEYAQQAAASVGESGWSHAKEIVVDVLERELYG